MSWKNEWKPLLWLTGGFLILFFLPLDSARFDNAVIEALQLVKWYAREHVVLCLVTAFYIAGAIAVFINQNSVMKYLGSEANKALAYGVASVSGAVLAVCSCTVLPLFSGIYKMGAGLGPASSFLYAGPAINVLAIVLTARVLGIQIGIARAIGAIFFSIIIGLLMHVIFRKEERERVTARAAIPEEANRRRLWKTSVYFLSMIGILVFANLGKPDSMHGIWHTLYSGKWLLTIAFTVLLGTALIFWYKVAWWKMMTVAVSIAFTGVLWGEVSPLIPFGTGIIVFSVFMSISKGETGDWFFSSWGFAKQITPLLFFGVIIAGFLLGRANGEGIIPSEWIYKAVGGNSVQSNLFASVAGAFMYFATLTEVPVLQGLIQNGMGQGPALALLLAGPALSLPNMLVIRSVMGTKKTIVFVLLTIGMSTCSGIIYGTIA
jgi:uncharacterized membrane protein YraQ (UPF0718 family)